MTIEKNVNSKDYWDYRFANNWVENAGKLQTLYFCDIACQLFPTWLHKRLNMGVTFADVGCAEGDSVNFLAQKYPNSNFTGIDFSEEAIRKAKIQFPDTEFISADIREMNLSYDIVFSSNTLEHFHDPFSIMKHLFRCAKQYVVLLLPFQERDRFTEHFYTFEYEDFDIKVEDFTIVYSSEFDCSKKENIFWAGKQLLLIYEKIGVEREETLSLKSYVGELSENYNELKVSNDSNLLFIEELKNKIEKLESHLEGIINITKDQQDTITKLNENIYNLNQQLVSYLTEANEFRHKYYEVREELDYLQRQEAWLIKENYNLSFELKQIHLSNFWKVSNRYYNLRDKTPVVKHMYKSMKFIKYHGIKTFIRVAKHKIMKNVMQQEIDHSSEKLLTEIYKDLMNKSNKFEIKGVAIIPSAFPFDELYNQRTINLAKYLSSRGIATLFVIWQWERTEVVEQSFEEVYPLVYSIPMYTFIDNIKKCKELVGIGRKYAFLNTPSSNYIEILGELRTNGFDIYYDVMDEWEQFSLVGQAPWYDKDLEECLVLHADKVVVVSQPLANKFSHLRQDIVCIGNGYYESLLGSANIANKKMNNDHRIHVGYFGHLTESWFDWNLIFKVLADKSIFLHIIGYGASQEIVSKLKGYSNAKYYGKVKPTELNNYVRQWHIGIIPFTNSVLSQAVDPIKIYEYLYFGLPTIVTGIDHLHSIPYVIVSSNDEHEFIQYIKTSYELIENGSYIYDQLGLFLKDTTWEERFNKMLSLSAEEDNVYARLYKK